jgi:hypothetical protein
MPSRAGESPSTWMRRSGLPGRILAWANGPTTGPEGQRRDAAAEQAVYGVEPEATPAQAVPGDGQLQETHPAGSTRSQAEHAPSEDRVTWDTITFLFPAVLGLAALTVRR